MSPEIFAARRAIVREARDWIGTPYHHLGDIKGVGVDCAMHLIRSYQSTGHIDKSFDPRPYEPEWFLHRDAALYMSGLEKWAHRIDAADVRIGDIAMYNFGRHAAHGAIIVSDQMIVHAYKPHGNVELCEMRAHAHRFDSYWSVFA